MRTVRELNDFWRFTKLPAGMNISKDYVISPEYEDTSWQPVELPHTYNSEDSSGRMTVADGGDYYRGTVCYRRTLALSFEECSGKELYLEFEGANTVAEVYINGRFAGEHSGGYSAFRFDITDYIYPDKDNLIAVIVSNAPTDHIAPITDNGDFTKMGGLYRGVKLITVEPVHIALKDSGSCGVYITPHNISETSADIGILVKLDKAETAEAKAVIFDPQGKPVTEFFSRACKDRITLSGKINSPKLWNGVNSPALYRAEITLFYNGKPVDTQSEYDNGERIVSVNSGIKNGEEFDLSFMIIPDEIISNDVDSGYIPEIITKHIKVTDRATVADENSFGIPTMFTNGSYLLMSDKYLHSISDKFGYSYIALNNNNKLSESEERKLGGILTALANEKKLQISNFAIQKYNTDDAVSKTRMPFMISSVIYLVLSAMFAFICLNTDIKSKIRQISVARAIGANNGILFRTLSVDALKKTIAGYIIGFSLSAILVIVFVVFSPQSTIAYLPYIDLLIYPFAVITIISVVNLLAVFAAIRAIRKTDIYTAMARNVF